MPASNSRIRREGGSPAVARLGETHGRFILSAMDKQRPVEAADALERLCRVYWPPLYAYVRRLGESPHDAQDLTQEFFARFLDKDYLAAVDQAKGRFRSFMLAALKHFLANERDKQRAQKRGGGCSFVPIDFPKARGIGVAGTGAGAVAERVRRRRQGGPIRATQTDADGRAENHRLR